MNTDLPTLVPEGISHTPDISKLSKEDRLKHHRKALRSISFLHGLDGVRAYKKEHPEADPIQVSINTLAYSRKPPGYDRYLTSLAARWLTNDTALARSNAVDVAALNARFDTSRFNPAKHFSEPLSKGRLKKLETVFAEHGFPLDTAKADTMSKVRAAAKAARASQGARPFGNVGLVSGNTLVIGGRSFPIVSHHGHECIRISVNGDRLRLRLDALEAVFGGLSDEVGEADPPPEITTVRSIGEVVPKAAEPDFDPLATPEISERVPEASNQISELVPTEGQASPSPVSELAHGDETPTLKDRVAALKAAASLHSTASADGADPLAL